MARRRTRRIDPYTLLAQQQRSEIVGRIGNKREYMRNFDSLGECLNYALKGGYITSDLRWSGGMHKSEAVHATQQGTVVKPATLDQAMKLLDKIDASFRDREVQTWQPSMMGAYPIVPDYLMGRMDSMRMKCAEENTIAPIKIYIECAVSAGVTHDQLTRRGTAIAALLQRMSEDRPVELYMFAAWELETCDDHYAFWTVRIDSTPVSVSQVLHVIAEPTFLRMINFNVTDALAKDNGDVIKWGAEGMDWAYKTPGMHSSNDAGREKNLRRIFGLQPQDVIMQRGYLPDAEVMERDPVAWVHAQLEAQRKVDDAL